MRVLSLAVAMIFGAAGGLALAQSDTKSKNGEKKDAGAKAVNVKLAPQNKSGESGTARLSPEGKDKTRVVLNMKGAPKGTPQPAHIHDGPCAKLNPKPKIPLENVVDGKSSTVVPASLDSLTDGTNAINVHKSTEDLKTYVACGDIPKAGAEKNGGGAKKGGGMKKGDESKG